MTRCLPYECGVWHPAAQAPAAPTTLGWGPSPSFGVQAALRVACFPFSPLREWGRPSCSWASGEAARCIGGTGQFYIEILAAPASFPTPTDHYDFAETERPQDRQASCLVAPGDSPCPG